MLNWNVEPLLGRASGQPLGMELDDRHPLCQGLELSCLLKRCEAHQVDSRVAQVQLVGPSRNFSVLEGHDHALEPLAVIPLFVLESLRDHNFVVECLVVPLKQVQHTQTSHFVAHQWKVEQLFGVVLHPWVYGLLIGGFEEGRCASVV